VSDTAKTVAADLFSHPVAIAFVVAGVIILGLLAIADYDPDRRGRGRDR
jgi:hypothetical protein